MLKSFRVVSLLEGFSYLAILSVTLGFVSRDYVSVLGMAHGVLFMLYLFLLSAVSSKHKWPFVTHLSLFVASLIPFAFIAVELFLNRQVASQKLTEA